eukprot:6184300-Pleurochrysis_carterae.AAC.2
MTRAQPETRHAAIALVAFLCTVSHVSVDGNKSSQRARRTRDRACRSGRPRRCQAASCRRSAARRTGRCSQRREALARTPPPPPQARPRPPCESATSVKTTFLRGGGRGCSDFEILVSSGKARPTPFAPR